MMQLIKRESICKRLLNEMLKREETFGDGLNIHISMSNGLGLDGHIMHHRHHSDLLTAGGKDGD